MEEQIMKAQGYAVRIERLLARIFKSNTYAQNVQTGEPYKCGFGGQVAADCIRKHPFLSMTQGLAYLYALYPEKMNVVDGFISEFDFYSDMSLDYILSFDTNEKIEGINITQIEKENGLKQIEYMIEKFNNVINDILENE